MIKLTHNFGIVEILLGVGKSTTASTAFFH